MNLAKLEAHPKLDNSIEAWFSVQYISVSVYYKLSSSFDAQELLACNNTTICSDGMRFE